MGEEISELTLVVADLSFFLAEVVFLVVGLMLAEQVPAVMGVFAVFVIIIINADACVISTFIIIICINNNFIILVVIKTNYHTDNYFD